MTGRLSTLWLDLSTQQSIATLLEAEASAEKIIQLYRCHTTTVYQYKINIKFVSTK